MNYPWDSEGGNIDEDPRFVNADDYHITMSSPCWNAGTALAPGLPPINYDGQNRVIGGAPDMGADEFLLTLVPHKDFSQRER